MSDPLDQRVLTAVSGLRGNGCAENIAGYLSVIAGVRVPPASVSASLERLEKQGLVIAISGQGSTCFRISTGGQHALAIQHVIEDVLGEPN